MVSAGRHNGAPPTDEYGYLSLVWIGILTASGIGINLYSINPAVNNGIASVFTFISTL